MVNPLIPLKKLFYLLPPLGRRFWVLSAVTGCCEGRYDDDVFVVVEFNKLDVTIAGWEVVNVNCGDEMNVKLESVANRGDGGEPGLEAEAPIKEKSRFIF